MKNVLVPRSYTVFLLVLHCLLASIPAVRAADDLEFAWRQGHLHNGTVYTAVVPGFQQGGESPSLDTAILSCSLDRGALLQTGSHKTVYQELRGVYFSTLRWRIYDGYYWGLSASATYKSSTIKRVQAKHCRILESVSDWNPEYAKVEQQELCWMTDPVSDFLLEYAKARFQRDPNWGVIPGMNYVLDDVYFDVQPVSSDTALLFHVHDRKMRVWQGKSRKPTQKEKLSSHRSLDIAVDWVEQKDLGCMSQFNEPFQAFGDIHYWYFMTSSGKLLLSRKPPEGQKRKLELLYADTDSPIKSLITDTATNKTFAFTAPDEPKNAKGKRVYFELAPKLDPKPYEVKPLTGVKIDYRVKTIWELAQVLVADGKVKAP